MLGPDAAEDRLESRAYICWPNSQSALRVRLKGLYRCRILRHQPYWVLVFGGIWLINSVHSGDFLPR